MFRCYYDLKYPYLHYYYTDDDGGFIMFSVPPMLLFKTFEAYFYEKPKTFFDCGAAVGVIVQMALDCGMDAHGIDIKKYPPQHHSHLYIKNQNLQICYPNSDLEKLYESGRIQIKSILDCEPINADIAYCNGVLTYFDEKKRCQMFYQNSKTLKCYVQFITQPKILMPPNKWVKHWALVTNHEQYDRTIGG